MIFHAFGKMMNERWLISLLLSYCVPFSNYPLKKMSFDSRLIQGGPWKHKVPRIKATTRLAPMNFLCIKVWSKSSLMISYSTRWIWWCDSKHNSKHMFIKSKWNHPFRMFVWIVELYDKRCFFSNFKLQICFELVIKTLW